MTRLLIEFDGLPVGHKLIHVKQGKIFYYYVQQFNVQWRLHLNISLPFEQIWNKSCRVLSNYFEKGQGTIRIMHS